MHPGSLGEQYNVCGKAGCAAKTQAPAEARAPYYQLSFTWRGKSTTRFVRPEARGGDAAEGSQLQALPGTGERMGGPGSGAGAGRAGAGETCRWKLIPTNSPAIPAALRQMVMGLLGGSGGARAETAATTTLGGAAIAGSGNGPRREAGGRKTSCLCLPPRSWRESENTPPDSGEAEAPPSDSKSTPQRPGHGRGALPKNLMPRQVRVVHESGGRRTAQLSPVPGRFEADGGRGQRATGSTLPPPWWSSRKCVRNTACPKGCTVITRQKPMAPMRKGWSGPGLLAQVALRKYWDSSASANRQADIFCRQRCGVVAPDDGRLDCALLRRSRPPPLRKSDEAGRGGFESGCNTDDTLRGYPCSDPLWPDTAIGPDRTA